jgi:cytochrome b subunit of formate dehydrogenase
MSEEEMRTLFLEENQRLILLITISSCLYWLDIALSNARMKLGSKAFAKRRLLRWGEALINCLLALTGTAITAFVTLGYINPAATWPNVELPATVLSVTVILCIFTIMFQVEAGQKYATREG